MTTLRDSTTKHNILKTTFKVVKLYYML